MKKNDVKKIIICQLYPTEMNIYGDFGNALALAWRAKNYGFSPEIIHHEIGDDPKNTILRADILLGGGGQDSGQGKILKDLISNGEILRKIAKRGTPMLMICGMYQLFGKFFQTVNGEKMRGIGIFDAKTIGSKERMIGNIVTMSEFGILAGYENHSGKTLLGKGAKPLGAVLSGAGNNGEDSVKIAKNFGENFCEKNRGEISGNSEGSRIFNVFGSYLHGPILPKNIALTDEILRIANKNKFGENNLKPINNSAKENLARANFLAKKSQMNYLNR